MKTNIENSIGEIVAADYRTAAVFHSYGIDFCCKGNRSLEEVCEERSVDLAVLMKNLEEITSGKQENMIDYSSWDVLLLTDYIERIHHAYVNQKTPVIQQFLEKICRVHGQKHPELFEIRSLFNESAGELAQHMKKEELILFPYIRNLYQESTGQKKIRFTPGFGTIKKPILMMQEEHNTEGERFAKIAALTQNYLPPEGACRTYCVTFAMLKEFEEDLHLHIHLENNILFPKSIELESEIKL